MGRGRTGGSAGTGGAAGLLPRLSGPFAASVAIHGAILTAAGLIAVGGARPERSVVIEAASPEFIVVAEDPPPPPQPPEERIERPSDELPDARTTVAELADPFEWPSAVSPGTEAAPVLSFATSLSHRIAPARKAPQPVGSGDVGTSGTSGSSVASGSPGGGTPSSVPRPPAPAPGVAGGGGVSRGARFRETPSRPDYPSIARRRGWEGRVVLRLEIGADGAVGDVAVSQSSGRSALDEAAVEGAFRWRFEPALEDGRPVASTIEKAVEFRLVD